jgi:hypothetical protein
MLAHRFPALLWALVCVAIWAWLARDALTIIICAFATVPYTVHLIRESRRRIGNDTSGRT